ncbi:signal peptidase complex subunit 3-like [Lineus longissimus]|uniref:signal peptidase complex subunit 3-like n=1 Tax=Lineus longissimus TaxID=88925 RepID=UPI002B4E4D49
MNTFLARLNTIFAFTLTVMAVLTFLCFLSTAFKLNLTKVKLNTVKAIVKNVPDYSQGRDRSDLGFLTFDLQSDLNEVFNWNCKQLFLFLTAEYETKNNAVNQVVLWDKIIQRGENGKLDYKSMHTKYYFWDDGHGLKANNNITLSLSWNIIPNAGGLPLVKGDGSHTFGFPNEYASSRV